MPSTPGFQPITGSSNIAGAGYDAETRVLTVRFHSGLAYQYENVPENIYDELVSAPSAGRYFNANIKNQFRTT